MSQAELLQWGLLASSAALLLLALAMGARRPGLRPWAFAAGFLAATHLAYYWLFLAMPDVLDGNETMLFSVVLRYQVLFTAALLLVLAAAREQWRR